MKRVYTPGSLVQGLRVTNKYTSSSAKGPDSDKVKCKALDISPSLTKRETKPLKILKILVGTSEITPIKLKLIDGSSIII